MARTAAEESLDVEEINDRNIGISRYEDGASKRSDDDDDDALLTQVQIDYRKEERSRKRNPERREKRKREDSDPHNVDSRGDEIFDYYGNPIDQRGNRNRVENPYPADVRATGSFYSRNKENKDRTNDKKDDRDRRGDNYRRHREPDNRDKHRDKPGNKPRNQYGHRDKGADKPKVQEQSDGNKRDFSWQYCYVCKEKGHCWLLRCPQLKDFIPYGTGSKRITPETCKDCLATSGHRPCYHKAFSNWKEFNCPISKFNILICSRCDHKKAQEWMKNNYEPTRGKGNLNKMIEAIGNEDIVVNLIRVTGNQQDQAQGLDQRPATQKDQNQRVSIADIEDITDSTDQVQVQAVLVNNMRIGRSCSPYEVIWVKTKSGNYPVTIIYDTGSQITICNYESGPLVIGEKMADKRVTISTVNSA